MATAPPSAGRTLLYDGLAQNDVDMAHHRLLNLDTSNLPPVGIPPTVDPPDSQWLDGWNATTQTWHSSRPQFLDIAGVLTTGELGQQRAITELGTIRTGVWSATPLSSDKVPTLDAIRAPVNNVSLAGKRLTNVGMPVDPNDAVNLAFMDLLLQGLNPKAAVRCATTSRRALSGLPIIDGVQLAEGDRILVKDDATSGSIANGIYIAHAGAWTRSSDADTSTELTRAYVTVLEGTVNSGTSWVQINPLTEPLNTDDIIYFVQFSTGGGASVIAGAGLMADGNTLNVGGSPGRIAVNPDNIDIDADYAGQTSIHTLGMVTTGTWQADVIAGARGGTGLANSGRLITLCGNYSTEIPVEFPDVGGGRNLAFRLKDHTSLLLPPSGQLATTSGVENFKNKNITKRTVKIASAAKPAIDVSVTDVFHITGLVEDIASMTDQLTGAPDNGQELFIWIRSASGAGPPGLNINWGAKFTASASIPLPVLLAPFERLLCWFIYNDDINLWVLTQNVRNLT